MAAGSGASPSTPAARQRGGCRAAGWLAASAGRCNSEQSPSLLCAARAQPPATAAPAATGGHNLRHAVQATALTAALWAAAGAGCIRLAGTAASHAGSLRALELCLLYLAIQRCIAGPGVLASQARTCLGFQSGSRCQLRIGGGVCASRLGTHIAQRLPGVSHQLERQVEQGHCRHAGRHVPVPVCREPGMRGMLACLVWCCSFESARTSPQPHTDGVFNQRCCARAKPCHRILA